MATHSKGIAKGKFCAVRTGSDAKCKCDSPNNYVDNCDVPGDFFLQGSSRRVEKKFEAHHLLCVASVTQFMAKDADIVEIIKKTRWCINAKRNMYAMPLWGHTIQHYCDLVTRAVDEAPGAPWFQDIPQHDYNHNSKGGYKSEIDRTMAKLADDIKKLADDKHKEPEKDLTAALDTRSDRFKRILQVTRGKRVGGTHAAWQKGAKEPTSDWYLPFSMSNDRMTDKRSFPAGGMHSDGKVGNKIAALAKALKKWGST